MANPQIPYQVGIPSALGTGGKRGKQMKHQGAKSHTAKMMRGRWHEDEKPHKQKTQDFKPVKRPGAATKAAKREGESLSKWEQEHKHDKGKIGKEARFPLIAKKWKHKGRKKKAEE